jgi:voltage-gated sodium channel
VAWPTPTSGNKVEVLEQAKDIKDGKNLVEEQKFSEKHRRNTLPEIVDDGSRMGRWRHRVDKLLSRQKFDAGVGVIIVINSLCMGIETSYELENRDLTVFQVLEHFFLFVYVAELALRFFAHGCGCLRSPWVAFDFILVFMGVVSNYIVGPIIENFAAGNDSVKDSMAGLLVLRMLRLFRLARAVRLLVQFKTLWMLIRGLMGSAGTIAYTFGLILLILYIFSCMAMELITKKMRDSEDEVIQALVTNSFPNIPIAMLTLLQFVSMDSIASIYHPLIVEDPVLLVFFLPFILVVSISLMNLVTAVIVEGAIEQGKQDREAQSRYKAARLKHLIPALKKLFKELDADGDETLTLKEIQNAPESVRQEFGDFMQADSLEELFEMVDVDDSGEVDIEEFCDGIAKVVNSDTAPETIRILKQLSVARKEMSDLRSSVSVLEQDMKKVCEQNEDILKHLKNLATRDKQDLI